MITLNNSNIDFGFEDESMGSKYSISLSKDTSNFVFRTDGVERMTIMKNGKVGIGKVSDVCDLDVNGSINARVYLIDGVDISTSAITGDTSNYVTTTCNLLIDRIRDTSNYVGTTSNILINDINNTCNYTPYASNILVGRIINTSNNVTSASNILVGLINDTSNYVTSASNILVGRIINTSNYVTSASNILISCIKDTSNYVTYTSNIFEDFLKLISNNYGITSSGNPISGNIGDYKYMIFTYTTDTISGSGQTQYDINVIGPASGLIGEILMVGGGGAGGRDFGGGGGGGAVLYGSNISIPLGPSTIYVGRGAILGETIGKSTTGFGATILGGGSATDSAFNRSSALPNANSGGGGAGGKTYFLTTTDLTMYQSGGSSNLSSLGNLTGATLYNGYDGGTGYHSSGITFSGRGGGAGSSGNNGNAGDGVLVNILGVDYYWGGGGGCAGFLDYLVNANILLFDGGKGGGGPGQIYGVSDSPYGNAGTNSYTSLGTSNFGRDHTGGGGGGGARLKLGGNGGSGIIIIKYFPSSYVEKTGNILIGRINDTSNYVWNTSNILVGRINDTSNYVGTTSNILIGRINDTSNYVGTTSNILIGRINDTSNYVWNTSNILIGHINNTNNYVKDTCNILVGHIVDTSNYVASTSNILVGRIVDTSNYVASTSNILLGHINNTNNYVKDTSNILVGRIVDTSNYVEAISNILLGRIVVTSNYVKDTSNILVGRIVDTSNYVKAISNILVGRIVDTSNYVEAISNILVVPIVNTSNYVWNTSNILISSINNNSNYVRITQDNLISFVNTQLSSISQWVYNKNDIYYNVGNVGIGTTIPESKLNIYFSTAYFSTALIPLTLENKQSPFVEISGNPPTMIGTTDKYKYLIYTYTTETTLNTGQTKYDIIVPSGGITCDILMVGGGGGGGGAGGSYIGGGGGGGGGSVYYGKNVIINQGTYSIYVGRGGTPTDNVANSSHGFSTTGFGGTILGGQTANIAYNNNTGSSAGANLVYNNPSPGVTDYVSNSTAPTFNYIEYSSIWNGNKGGVKTPYISGTISEQQSYQAGGGGGAGTPAKLSYYNSGVAEADGGDGVLVDILGTDLYWGGGGGGAGYNTVHGNGGLGGGGSGNGTIGISYEGKNSFYRPSKSTLIDAGPHTGGGGGGSTNGIAGSGGSGIIIIRYSSNVSSSCIELVNGIPNDDKINYKFGNYNDFFKITSFKNNINTDNLVINIDGNLGIGTLPSNYRLEVSECLTTKKRGAIISVEAEQTLTQYYLGRSDNILNTTFNMLSIINICARFNGSIWITGECLFALNCDARIKEDIQDINDDSALQMILAIEPKTYKYIDKIENGDKKVYGFIAQQVQKVIPEAVSLENAYIPNIMILADYNNNIIMLPHKPAKVIIKIKDKIKCYDSNNNLIEVEVSEIINDISFKIKDLDKKYTNNKIFVYGTFVNDFYTLSKEHIYTLNVGATQELYKQIKEHNDIIKSNKRINTLQKQNKNLNENYEMLLKEITLIKQKINSKYLPII